MTDCDIFVYAPGSKTLKKQVVEPDALSSYQNGFELLPGPLDLSEEKRKAVRKAVRSIGRIAPDTSIIICKSLSQSGVDISGSYVHPSSGPLIILSTKRRKSHILTVAFHEVFHRCESLMTPPEWDVMKKFAASMDELPMPDFLYVWESNGYAEKWWADPSERTAWAFQQYVYVRDGWKAQPVADAYGFCLTIDDFPDDVVQVYERVLSGEIGRRAIPEPRKKDGFIIRCLMHFLGAGHVLDGGEQKRAA